MNALRKLKKTLVKFVKLTEAEFIQIDIFESEGTVTGLALFCAEENLDILNKLTASLGTLVILNAPLEKREDIQAAIQKETSENEGKLEIYFSDNWKRLSSAFVINQKKRIKVESIYKVLVELKKEKVNGII